MPEPINLEAVKVWGLFAQGIVCYDRDGPEDVKYFTTDLIGRYVGWMADDDRFPIGSEDIITQLQNAKGPGTFGPWELREFCIDFTKLPWTRQVISAEPNLNSNKQAFVAVYHDGQCLGVRELEFYMELPAIGGVWSLAPGPGYNGLLDCFYNSTWSPRDHKGNDYPEVFQGWEMRVYLVDFTDLI